MSLFDRFSFVYNIDKSGKQSDSEDYDVQTIKQRAKAPVREFLGEETVKPLIGFGFDMEQIMMAFKMYKFTTVDEAVYILMKDPETRKYNHRYVPSNSKQGGGYGRVKEQFCFLCGEDATLHTQLDGDSSQMDVKLDVTRKKKPEEEEENKDTSTYCDRSNNPILKTNDISAILEAKNNQERKTLQLQKVEIPKEVLELFEDPEVCRICFAEVLNHASQAEFPCGHKFCRTCVTSHLNINITNGKVVIYNIGTEY